MFISETRQSLYATSQTITGETTMSQTRVGPDRGSNTSTPRWVKVFGIIVIVLVLLFVILHLADPDRHGPGRHTPVQRG
jgi:hypothetical protein